MKFVGIDPLPEHRPVSELRNGEFGADLHNDASFEGLEIHRSKREVVLRWHVRNSSWRQEGDRVVAGLTLVCRQVQLCTAEGKFVSEQRSGPAELDFVEYAATGNAGSLRFVFEDKSEIEIIARSCEMLLLS